MILTLLKHSKTPWIAGLLAGMSLTILLVIDYKIVGESHFEILAWQLTSSKSESLKLIQLWGQEGVQWYLKTVWIDYLFPIAYSILGASLLTRTLFEIPLKNRHKMMAFLIMMPFLAAFFDFVENAYQIVQVLRGASLPEWLFTMTFVIALCKWSFVIFSVLVIVVLKWRKG